MRGRAIEAEGIGLLFDNIDTPAERNSRSCTMNTLALDQAYCGVSDESAAESGPILVLDCAVALTIVRF